ncbi:hypothetical protein BDM02DRAFT_3182155 [Thelephora ganbajun]|uniref:Uncharacterized protein n=1 Tax=Thelephora ganbajun TaxID=370292 RepID=A0ACB6ZXM7_THEGA|nr:hypothetical protein BDM02DRAFT_3182155 [Thelephora ganbajun]
MFFTPELLSRRDSGFGLLWLAATLGSKSSFKKLPRRSVLSADISQLCDLIAEPKEPLALRLSSNLMVGVARVYQVKHEIFLVDVTACFNSLRKTFQDLALTSNEATLQMNQPTLRPEVLNLPNDPARNMAFDFAATFVDWEDMGPDDEEYDPKAINKPQKKKRAVTEAMPPPSSEIGRPNLYTLPEDHSHIFSNSMDLSFSGDAGFVAPSSQVDAYGFDDNLFGGPGITVDGPDVADELARELGEGWGGDHITDGMGEDLLTQVINDPDMDLDLGGDLQHADPAVVGHPEPSVPSREGLLSDSDKENRVPLITVPLEGTQESSITASAPHITPMQEEIQPSPKPHKTRNKRKGEEKFLDERTELTSDELKEIRETYLQRQDVLRSEMEVKRREREATLLFDQLLWAVPHDITAPEIVEFWRENLRIRFDTRLGIQGVTEKDPEPPRKRRRTRASPHVGDQETLPQVDNVDPQMDVDIDYRSQREVESTRLRSSEEPGQARHASRPPSMAGSHLDFVARGMQEFTAESQKSSLFPWDNAGVSSSAGFDFGVGFGTPNISSGIGGRLMRRSRSASGREGSLVRSLAGSPVPFSFQNEGHLSDDFQFRVPEEGNSVTSLRPDMNLKNLERKSHDFLKYVKMLLQTLPGTDALSFDDVVPKAPKASSTETRRVAAAAFYHCLVLSTKDLVRLEQEEPYGRIEIMIK